MTNNQSELSGEDIRLIDYGWDSKHDIFSCRDKKQLTPILETEEPELLRAWRQLQDAKILMRAAMANFRERHHEALQG